MELLEALTQTFDHASEVVAAVGTDQLDGPTTCTAWTVRDLLAHTIGVVVNMGRGASGEALLPDVNAVRLDPEFDTQFRAETSHTLAAWEAHGLDGEVDIGAGRPIPAVVGIRINLIDTTTHCWDLAASTGQDTELPPALAREALDAARGVVPIDARALRGFDPPVAVGDDATPTVELVAFLGRRP